MTTTLRPAGPEASTPDGARARRFDIMVNSRPVGSVRLAAGSPLGLRLGRIEDLSVEQPDRRRGRATVAALAAEEVLRGWGCRQIEVEVPDAADAALGLATALGYVERSSTMAKDLLPPPPDLPPGYRARSMDDADFARWHAAAVPVHARVWADRGLAPGAATAKAEADHATRLPDGASTRGTALRVLSHAGADVGTLWVALPTSGRSGAYVFDVGVPERHRRQGHGRVLMGLAEREALAAGARQIGLNVFAGNTPALRLYTSLGYRTRSRHLCKSL
ncbi:GNAT family N-acetyltransferase [Streptomyces sp. 549]|uniref:GNAT family N-acetyltransferase n=1 Tax=Streptomyces sp. 549 TaxID=3049076 RepID=UPI0024C471D5|nr:GNAT family N-acetyltransferase [Streptomyces sp. 549]MDK1473438.1 GNAT family N-acetyltransferase [Streptomyces sp. 549]